MCTFVKLFDRLLSILGNSSDHQAEQTEVQPEQVTQQEYSANGHPGLPGIVEEDDLEDEDLKKPISGHLKLVIMPVSTLGIILVIVLLMRVKPHLTSGIMKYQEFYQTFSKSVCQVCKLVAPNPPKLLNGNFVEELNKSELVFEQVALNKVD